MVALTMKRRMPQTKNCKFTTFWWKIFICPTSLDLKNIKCNCIWCELGALGFCPGLELIDGEKKIFLKPMNSGRADR